MDTSTDDTTAPPRATHASMALPSDTPPDTPPDQLKEEAARLEPLFLLDPTPRPPPPHDDKFHDKLVSDIERLNLHRIGKFPDASDHVLLPESWWDGTTFVPGTPPPVEEEVWVRFQKLVRGDGTPNDACNYVTSASATVDSRLRLFKDMRRCCDWMERRGFVHRDVKFENVMWTGERWVLIDLDSVTQLSEDHQPFGETEHNFKVTYMIPRKVYNTRHSMRLQVVLQLVRLIIFFRQRALLDQHRYREESSLETVKEQCIETRIKTTATTDPLACLLVRGYDIDQEMIAFCRRTFERLWPEEKRWRWRKRDLREVIDPHSPSQWLKSPTAVKKCRASFANSPVKSITPMANITNTADHHSPAPGDD